jgi:hypothetical protein
MDGNILQSFQLPKSLQTSLGQALTQAASQVNDAIYASALRNNPDEVKKHYQRAAAMVVERP